MAGGDPELVGPLRRETPLHQIGGRPRITVPHGCLEPFAPTDPDLQEEGERVNHKRVARLMRSHWWRPPECGTA
jgi:hypothetical protein